jgi:hypothetical protein
MLPKVRTRRTTAWLLLAALVGIFAPVVDGHHADLVRDVDCGESIAFSRHPTTQFEPVVDPVGTGHCVACHLQRTLHTATPTTARLVAPLRQRERFRWTSNADPVPSDLASLPSRAPPAILL